MTFHAGGDGRDKRTTETWISHFRNPVPYLHHREYWN